jgi:glycosyltransferase involved in cell wall biosynthesis
MTKLPLITIGMPVYNAEAHIGFALEGLLAQTCTDFELLVSDNASTDGTREIVERYGRQDARIHYERQPVNVGPADNYSLLVRRARGQFFKWAASSDWCAPTFLERCKVLLTAHEDTVLVAPRTRTFQETPDVSEDYPWDIEVLGDTPSARLTTLTATVSLNNAMNGLIRLSDLKRTRLIGRYLGADLVLLGHLALLGKFRLVEERLFYRRMSVTTATALQDRAAVWRFHYPQLTAAMLFQGLKRHASWARVALSAPIPVQERMWAITHVARRCYWDRKIFLKDLQGAWRYYTRGTWPD